MSRMSLLPFGSPRASAVILLAARIYPPELRERRLGFGDIVEPSCRLFRRQKRRNIHVEFSKSWIERAYSVWLSRWNERQPGFGCAAAALSIAVPEKLRKP